MTTRGVIAISIVAVSGVLACSEPFRADRVSLMPAETVVIPRLVVGECASGAALVTLALDIRGALQSSARIGSFTGRVRYDSSAVAFAAEVPHDDGALRAVNPVGGLLRVAGASRKGFDPAQLAVYRFVVRDCTALARVVFEVDELHDVSRADMGGHVRRVASREKP